MPNKFPVPPTTRKRAAHPHQSASSADQTHNTAFDECHQRYQECLEYRDLQSGLSLQETIENYILDFELAAKRSIGANSERFDLFRLMFMESCGAEECCGRLGFDRFTFTREAREVKATVGAALVSRGLFPTNSYFNNDSLASPDTSLSPEWLAA